MTQRRTEQYFECTRGKTEQQKTKERRKKEEIVEEKKKEGKFDISKQF